jgi:repressor LexA
MREISLIKNNILQYLDFKGIKKSDFYRETGVSNGVLSQNNGFSEDNLMRFLNSYKDINPVWLLTGKGDMVLSGDASSKVSGIINPPTPVVPTGIPLVDVKAVGGFGNANFSITSQDVKEYYVIPKFKHKQIDFMIEVEGSSMYPKYNSGDIVACKIIRDSKFLQWNKTHVLVTKEQGIIIKRLKEHTSTEVLTMVSDNDNYPPFNVPKDEIDGIALVVGVIRLE